MSAFARQPKVILRSLPRSNRLEKIYLSWLDYRPDTGLFRWHGRESVLLSSEFDFVVTREQALQIWKLVPQTRLLKPTEDALKSQDGI